MEQDCVPHFSHAQTRGHDCAKHQNMIVSRNNHHPRKEVQSNQLKNLSKTSKETAGNSHNSPDQYKNRQIEYKMMETHGMNPQK